MDRYIIRTPRPKNASGRSEDEPSYKQTTIESLKVNLLEIIQDFLNPFSNSIDFFSLLCPLISLTHFWSEIYDITATVRKYVMEMNTSNSPLNLLDKM